MAGYKCQAQTGGLHNLDQLLHAAPSLSRSQCFTREINHRAKNKRGEWEGSLTEQYRSYKISILSDSTVKGQEWRVSSGNSALVSGCPFQRAPGLLPLENQEVAKKKLQLWEKLCQDGIIGRKGWIQKPSHIWNKRFSSERFPSQHCILWKMYARLQQKQLRAKECHPETDKVSTGLKSLISIISETISTALDD